MVTINSPNTEYSERPFNKPEHIPYQDNEDVKAIKVKFKNIMDYAYSLAIQDPKLLLVGNIDRFEGIILTKMIEDKIPEKKRRVGDINRSVRLVKQYIREITGIQAIDSDIVAKMEYDHRIVFGSM